MSLDIKTDFIQFTTKGETDIIDITNQVASIITRSGFREGNVTVFGIGSTTGISTIEYEPGLVHHDIALFWDKIAPYGPQYQHNQTWGDDNGAAHVRSTTQGSSLTVPFVQGEMLLGTWQQIIFIDFDTRPRSRKVAVQVVGK